MQNPWRRSLPWLAGGLLLVLVGGFALVRWDIAARRATFETDARIVHRLLSQRGVQNEAILETLVLLASRATGQEAAVDPAARLRVLYPQVVAVLRRDADGPWPDVSIRRFLDEAEARSREVKHAVLGTVDAPARRFTIVLAGDGASWALAIDVEKMVPWDEWPLDREGPVRVELAEGDRVVVVQPGAPAALQPVGLTPGFVFDKTLAATSQPFEVRVRRATGPAQWPWGWLAGWTLLVGLVLATLSAWRRGVRERERAEGLVRVGQVARLNALGELAGGLAHELNQPLAAALANAQAARRMLEDDPPEIEQARAAVAQATTQTRRAADVVARLRRQVESPDTVRPRRDVSLRSAARDVLDLLEPQLVARGIRVAIEGADVVVPADPVALEQIVHNLAGNAMQALDAVPVGERRLVVTVETRDNRAMLTVTDSGPGIADDVLPRLFEPFFTTKENGLGLGLSLCESLARSMDGTLEAANVRPRGASFRLSLPLTPTTAPGAGTGGSA